MPFSTRRTRVRQAQGIALRVACFHEVVRRRCNSEPVELLRVRPAMGCAKAS
ncbi:MAG: hypothetical protein HWQ38_36735 [Nostoc sp. NMS7]|uniref:hypothetical protein n=1 Tax=Nostoc sp. NMS7 TaxID=2815391 RepID=UPI0025E4A934|nr:hypothetical protein [Nostoc sp. NMS7]MBN3951712.1 hypothetical protein [Nostoc sp. NMS7]